MLSYYAIIPMLLFILGAGTLLNYLMARTSPSNLRVIWYLFSLTLVITGEVGLHARYINAISAQGQFEGDYGHLLEWGLNFMSDLNTDVLVFLAILVAVVLPQLISYVINGLFGCAATPLFAGRSTTLFVWAVIKSFTVCSGIWFAIFMMGAANMFDVPNLAGMGLFAGLLLLIAFGMLWTFEEGKAMLVEIFNAVNNRWPHLARPFLRIHRHFTRTTRIANNSLPDSNSCSELQDPPGPAPKAC
jgi:hypothetical protein